MSSKGYAEAIFLLQADRIEKQMLLQEFEAVLDGVVSLTEQRNQTCRALYLQINSSLQIRACVLFVIDIDSAGNTPPSWHLPFAQLVENAGKGPNLGAGFIRLTCSGQCSVPWHNNKLWSPDDFPDVFLLAQKAVAKNKLQFNFDAKEDDDDLPSDELDLGIYDQGQSDVFNELPPFDVQDRIEIERAPAGISSDLIAQQLHKKFKAFEKEYKQKIKSISQEPDQLSAKTREGYERRLLCVTEEYEKTLEEITQQLIEVKIRLEALSSQKKSLEEINQSQKQKIDMLQEKMEVFRKQAEQKSRKELQTITQKYEEKYSEGLNEINQKWRDDVEKKSEEIVSLHDQLAQLRKDVCDLRRDKIRLVNSGADKFLENIEKLGINFIAFHPGAGHISIPLTDMSSYMDSPITYAANRCLVTEAHYRIWLQHYENPICRFHISKNKEDVCGCRIKRVDVPKDFKSGITDRCIKHPSVSAEWGNVVKLPS
jgi:hypothetical protein